MAKPTTNTAFYTACMNRTVSAGFVADKVQLAGSSIQGLGHIFMWAGDMFTKYGWSGGILSVFGYAVGKTAEVRGGGDAITNLALGRLKETGGAFVVGLGLAGLGGPVTYAGNYMSSLETQCKIGNALNFGHKTKGEL